MTAHNLPAQSTPFIGRTTELAEIAQCLADPACRLLTLVGPGGIGKTQLAIHTAAQKLNDFAYGVYFVPLAPLSTPDNLITTLANALRFSFHEGGEPKQQILDYLSEKDLLLLLDNFEHLLDSVDLVADILENAPNVKILVTSRETLNLQQEWVRHIEGLSFPEDEQSPQSENYGAVQLFAECARHVGADFSLTKEWPYVVRICLSIQGMPLAVELAAAWLKTLACEDIASEIQYNVDFLATSLRNVPERHRSMRAVFEWSWQLLTQEEREIFRRLSVFRGGFRRDAAAAVARASLPMLSALVGKSLIKKTESGRYDLHELLRQYAWAKLTESDEANSTLNHHLGYFLELAETAEAELFRAEQVNWFNRLETEQANIWVAIDWSLESRNIAVSLRLTGALYYFWSLHGYHREGYSRLKDILSRPEAKTRTTGRAKALNAAGYIQWFQGNYVEARLLLEEALSIVREAGDRRGIALTTRNLGPVIYSLGEYEAARLLLEESLPLAYELQDRYGIGWSLCFLGDVVLQQGDTERAQERYRESIALLSEMGDKALLAYALRRLGLVMLGYKDYRQSITLCYESLKLNVAVSDWRAAAACLVGLAGIAITQGQTHHAAQLLGAVATFLDDNALHLLLPDRVEYEHHINALRNLLDSGIFNASWAEGQSLTLEQAIAGAAQRNPLEPKMVTTKPFDDAQIIQLPKAASQPLSEPFTERELEVLRLIVDGLSNPEIAERLVVGVSTIKKHVNHIFSKLDAKSRAQVIVRARDLDLL